MVFMLLCGNLIDNTESHKKLAVIADIIVATFYSIKATMLSITPFVDSSNELFFLNLSNIDLILNALHPIINILVLM